jgi:NAD(P)-dependent dehydrogenase (short-subunit alcohol dehydrogenase family)
MNGGVSVGDRLFSLTPCVALITGASKGIRRAVGLARRRAEILAIDRDSAVEGIVGSWSRWAGASSRMCAT